MVLSKVMLFSETVYLALVCFDENILPYLSKYCNKESGLQPTPYEPFGSCLNLNNRECILNEQICIVLLLSDNYIESGVKKL